MHLVSISLHLRHVYVSTTRSYQGVTVEPEELPVTQKGGSCQQMPLRPYATLPLASNA